MGYAGYVPAKLATKRAPLESALLQVKSVESLEVMHKLHYNTAIQPGEDKFRKVKLTNGKIKAALVDVAGALDAMKLLGWEEATDETGEPVLMLPKGRNITMAEVRTIQEAQEQVKKEAKSISRSSSASSMHSSKSSKDLEALRAQLEADKAERAAREPVTKGSTAQALPPSDGARIAGGKDAGFKHGCC
ncbi:hypothetical protein N2152v2_002075 [Parachlorella kessleri]